MKFTVIWSPAAEEQLAGLWLDGDDRPALQKSADELDHLLATDPFSVGESRLASYRIAFLPPLGCYFRIVAEDQRVVVVRAYRIKNSSTP